MGSKVSQYQILIGGCSRSGTTLLASMLAASPETVAIPESHFKIDLLKKIKPNSNGLYFTQEVARYVNNHKRFKIWYCPEPVTFSKKELNYRELMDELVVHYSHSLDKRNYQGWIDHTPGNLEHAPILSLLFPEAKFVHIVRDGRGFAASVKRLDWGMRDIIVAARHWRDVLIRDLNNELALGERVLRVYYEDLVTDPEKTLQKICRFSGLAYSSEMLKANGFITPSYTKKQHNLIGKGVKKDRAHAWKNALSPREVELFESVSGWLLKDLGYETFFESPNPRKSVTEFITFKLRNFFYRYYDPYVRRKRYKQNIAGK